MFEVNPRDPTLCIPFASVFRVIINISRLILASSSGSFLGLVFTICVLCGFAELVIPMFTGVKNLTIYWVTHWTVFLTPFFICGLLAQFYWSEFSSTKEEDITIALILAAIISLGVGCYQCFEYGDDGSWNFSFVGAIIAAFMYYISVIRAVLAGMMLTLGMFCEKVDEGPIIYAPVFYFFLALLAGSCYLYMGGNAEIVQYLSKQ